MTGPWDIAELERRKDPVDPDPRIRRPWWRRVWAVMRRKP